MCDAEHEKDNSEKWESQAKLFYLLGWGGGRGGKKGKQECS